MEAGTNTIFSNISSEGDACTSFVDLEEVKAKIIARHGIKLSDDDPILMLLTMHDIFLQQHDLLLQRHHAAARDLTLEKIGALDARTELFLKSFREELAAANLTESTSLLAKHADAMNAHRRQIRLMTIACTVIFALTLGLCFLAAGSLRGWW